MAHGRQCHARRDENRRWQTRRRRGCPGSGDNVQSIITVYEDPAAALIAAERRLVCSHRKAAERCILGDLVAWRVAKAAIVAAGVSSDEAAKDTVQSVHAPSEGVSVTVTSGGSRGDGLFCWASCSGMWWGFQKASQRPPRGSTTAALVPHWASTANERHGGQS